MTEFDDTKKYVYENDDPPLKTNLGANLQLLNRAILDNTNPTDTSARIKSSEAHRKCDEAKRAVEGNHSESAGSALKAVSDGQDERTVRQTVNNVVDQIRTTGVGSGVKRKLQGRGLRGAGVAPLEGVVRRGRTYTSMRSTPSPNRRKCGPKRVIRDPLQSMIRTTGFKQHIDQADCDKLSIDDSNRRNDDKDSAGSHGDNADLNAAELKAVMINLFILDRPQKNQAAVWAADLDKSIRKVNESTQT
ncbi:hypothetical protein F444_20559 [Plasmopara halstedii]|uniref:Uncharacterized protein n=1 Tax=Plasmopara halstedii TaxID=4781 RepID=A0A0P1A6F6_PLAHL|nr:hypothetical protein F444_20559 [Plasmopara halstedii]CEG35980.1 hypothetical protein F444_20559 [Plasmopara halstedii]|eukprot:XP_024572349.1 hypothetical protein F444_20559 [Plasmopara halstedii]